MDLPNELLYQIFFNFNYIELTKLKIVSKNFYNLISNFIEYDYNISKPINSNDPFINIYHYIESLKFKNYIIAGGLAVGNYFNKNFNEYNQSNKRTSDLDLFFYNISKEDFINNVKTLYNHLSCIYIVLHRSVHNALNNNLINIKDFNIIKNCNESFGVIRLILFDINNNYLFIDIIYTIYKNEYELLMDFDLPICQIGFRFMEGKYKFIFIDKNCMDNRECTIYSDSLYDEQQFKNKKILIHHNPNFYKNFDKNYLLKIDNINRTRPVKPYNFLFKNNTAVKERIIKYRERGFKINILPCIYGQRSIEDKEVSRLNHLMFYTI